MGERRGDQWLLLAERMSVHSKAAIITVERGIARAKSGECAAQRERSEIRMSAGMANEAPFAPFERFMNGSEMRVSKFSNQVWLSEPLVVGAAFELDHGGEGVEFVRKAARDGDFGNGVDEFQKRSEPRLDKNDAAVFSEDAPHFGECLFQVFGQGGEVVQATLNDEDVLATIRERKLAAIGNEIFCRPAIFGDQSGGEVHAFEARETEALQRVQAVAAAAKEFHDFCIARPLVRTQFPQPRNKLLNLLLRRFEAQVRGFPRIG